MSAPRIHPNRWRALTIWCIAMSIAMILALNDARQFSSDARQFSNDARRLAKNNSILIKRNAEIIVEIQKSRLISCKANYEGVREVFKPFFVPPGKRTRQQDRDIKRFNKTVDDLKRKCIAQTKVKKEVK